MRPSTVLFLFCLIPVAAAPAGEKIVPPRFLLEWGKQGAGEGEFHFPIGIAINSRDEVIVADFYNDRIQRISAEGKFLSAFPVLTHPGAIALDRDGNVLITHFGIAKAKEERKPDRLSVYSPDGKLLRKWGTTGTGAGEFDMPGGMAIDKDGRIYVADQTNRRVQVFDAQGKLLFKWGEYGVKPGQFGGNTSPKSRTGGPQFVALDSKGNVYTTEGSMGRIQKFTPEGKFLLAWGDNSEKPGSFGGAFTGFKDRKAVLQGPIAICIDKEDRVWVSAVNGKIQQFNSKGEYLCGFGEPGTKPGQFYAPHAMALDSKGNFYVVDAFNHRIQKFAFQNGR